MTTAFQPDGFQNDAFQIDAAINSAGLKKIYIPGQLKVEDATEKLARRIREGTVPPIAEPVVASTPDQSAEYTRKSEKLAKALTRLEAEKIALLAEISRLDGIQTAKAEAELLRKQQALILAEVQQAVVLEEIIVIDVAYVATVALTYQ